MGIERLTVKHPDYSEFGVAVTAAENGATVRISGDLDCYTAPQLRCVLLALVDDGARHLTLDLGDTQFVDSTGLSVLVGGLRRVREHGGSMVVRSPTDATRKLFEITGLKSVFDIS